MVVVPGHRNEGSPSIGPAGEPGQGPVVLVIDRQPLFLAALGSLLTSPPLNARLRFARDSTTVVDTVAEGAVDLVFCELRAQPNSALSLADHLNGQTPKVPLIVLGDSDDEGLLDAALKNNVAGLFTKDASLDEFLVGVNAVLAGHRALGAELMDKLLARLAGQSAPKVRNQVPLSATELDILRMIGEAKSVQAIAASRGISHKTVRNHMANIYRKLDLRSRTEAMLFAARMGLTTG